MTKRPQRQPDDVLSLRDGLVLFALRAQGATLGEVYRRADSFIAAIDDLIADLIAVAEKRMAERRP